MIISVENLGKRYSVRHQRERYVALRDVIAEKTAVFFRKLKSENAENLKSANGERETRQLDNLTSDVRRPTADVSVSASRNFSIPRASTEEFWALRNINFEV